tara:strand:+ start:18368 stop:19474 length:1107 start_codon:yes stop_codon:yes gene_type:complete
MSEAILGLLRPGLRDLHAYEVPAIADIEVKLDANESPYLLPAEAQEALGRELAQLPVNRYPDPRAKALRELLSEEYQVAPESLLFGNGSDEIIQILISCLARPRPGAERASILFPTPTFSVFQIFATTLGVDSVGVATGEDFALDMAAMREALAQSQPNLAFFARPNNPTGTLWSGDDLLTLAKEFPATLFVSDEAYGEYATGSLVASLASCPNLLVMKTLSKIGLAGLRVGFAIGDPALIAELDKARAPYNISSVNQVAAHWVMSNHRELLREQCAQIVSERVGMSTALQEFSEIRVFPSEANLILFRVGEAGAGQGPKLWQELCRRGVLIRTFGSRGSLADCLRVTLGTAAENQRFLQALQAALTA